jgi:Dockerin type I domain
VTRADAVDRQFGDLYCVRVKDPVVDRARGHDAGSQDADGSRCHVLGGAALACAPARADGVDDDTGSTPREALVFDRLCYRAECGDQPAAGDVTGRDEPTLHRDALGDHELTQQGTVLVCTPAQIIEPTNGEASKGAAGRSGARSTGHDSDTAAVTCGDVNGDTRFSASDALAILRAAVGTSSCLICVCDVDNSSTITATDALKVLKFAVGQPITLNCQADGDPIAWDGGGDGFSWTDGLNWSLDRIPNACDAATITGAAATVTHASGTSSVRSVVSDSALDLTGGTLTLRDTMSVAGLFQLRGATLVNAIVLRPAADSKLVMTGSGGTLDGVTMLADMDFSASAASVLIPHDLTLDGTATFASNTSMQFNGQGEQMLAGTGQLVFNAGSIASLINYSDSTLHVGPDFTIRGTGGTIGGTDGGVSMINDGTIASDVGGTLTIGTGAAWTNNRLLDASGGNLVSRGGWTNVGAVQVGAGFVLNATTGFSQADSGTLTVDIGGTASNAFGKVTVTGAAQIAGTLHLVLTGGFVPNLGDSFQIMTFGSASGTFATLDGADIGGGKRLDVTIGATGITVEVVTA